MKMARIVALLVVLCMTMAARAELRVSAAISLQEALQQIAKDYKAGGGDDVAFAFGASGQLATQIKEGADVDLFISAANKQVDDLEKAGLLVDGTRRVVVGNTLVLVVPAGAKDAPRSFADLADSKYKRIAIGEPRTVPAGDYATQTLAALKLTDAVKDRLILGTNVRQVLTYVENGEVAAGIVYATDAKQSGDKAKVVATADEKTHQPIVYPGAVIKASKQKDAALRFLDFLHSDKAQKTFTEKGFSMPAAAATAP